MAVMDFREGGYVFSRHKVKREFSYDQASLGAAQAGQGTGGAYSPIGENTGIGGKLARLTHYIGALASVSLMVGLLAWGWQLVSRDVSGVPIIRAIEGEARTTPDDPGGVLTNHTGLAVNSVAAGEQAKAPRQVAIAPSGEELSADDVAMGQLGTQAREPSHPSEVALDFTGQPVVPLSDREARAKAKADAERALADQAVNQAAILDAPASEGLATMVLTDDTGAPAQLNDGDTGVSVARPARRTRQVVTRSTSAAQTPLTSSASEAELKPALVSSASTKGPVVQVGAFDSSAVAQGEWQRLAGRNGSLFSGKAPVIQEHQANGRTFWRLRVAGFDSLSDARRFCSALQSSGTDCLALGK